MKSGIIRAEFPLNEFLKIGISAIFIDVIHGDSATLGKLVYPSTDIVYETVVFQLIEPLSGSLLMAINIISYVRTQITALLQFFQDHSISGKLQAHYAVSRLAHTSC